MKRFVKTLLLQDDPALMKEYRRRHAPGAVWQEVIRGIREVGVRDMEIYLDGNRLIMIMEADDDFDHEAAMKILASKPRQAEWEASMAKYQVTATNASAGEKWKMVERVFKLDL